jgi:excisionase family DNA binding protein
MTVPEASKELGVAASTLRHQIRLGKLEARKVGRGWFVTSEEVARYGRENRKAAA